MEKTCVEIDGVFYESIRLAEKALHHTWRIIKERCLSDSWVNHKIVPFRVTYFEKECYVCGEVKLLEEFNKKNEVKDRHQPLCRECQKKYKKEWDENNPDYMEKWFAENPEYRKEYDKEYNSRPEVADRKNKRLREKRKNDPAYRINQNISRSIRLSLKGLKHGRHWEVLVGYTLKELMIHLEKQFTEGMTWDNYGKDGWEIDHHPIPLHWFVFKSYRDKGFKKAWALENLRPMWSKLNASKGNKLFHS